MKTNRRLINHWFSSAVIRILYLSFALIAINAFNSNYTFGNSPEFVFTLVPANLDYAGYVYPIHFSPFDRYPNGCKIAASKNNGEIIELTAEFFDARDASVSFDGEFILFAGKKEKDDPWSVWRMKRDGSEKTKLTNVDFDCLSPVYAGAIFHLNDSVPTDQIIFTGIHHNQVNETGSGPVSSLYCCNIDGSDPRRITFNLSSDYNPEMLPFGRIVYSSLKRTGDARNPLNQITLMEINIDGADEMLFYGRDEETLKREMPRCSQSGCVYFIESNHDRRMGGGDLARVSLRRPLGTREVLAKADDGLYHSPCPAMRGDEKTEELYVSYRENQPDSAYAIYRFGEESTPVIQKEGWHCIDAHPLQPHLKVKGRSTLVDKNRNVGDYYCIDAYSGDAAEQLDLRPGEIKRVRIIEGVPLQENNSQYTKTPYGPKRILGFSPVESDGSFHVQIPAQTPVSFQLLDENGMALIKQPVWTWVMPRESRGCVGCHETPEISPPNQLPQALLKEAVHLTLPPKRRRTVDFLHDISPIMKERCNKCHGIDEFTPYFNIEKPLELYGVLLARIQERKNEYYIHPGWAKDSPLIWHILGERPQRGQAEYSRDIMQMPPDKPLDKIEKQLWIEWIDLGAPWDNKTPIEQWNRITPDWTPKGTELW